MTVDLCFNVVFIAEHLYTKVYCLLC